MTPSHPRVIRRPVARGLDFHALIWNSLLEKKQSLRMRDFVNALQQSNTTGKAEFIFDGRLPTSTTSTHQKTLFIQREDGEVVVAYVGGIDLRATAGTRPRRAAQERGNRPRQQ
ncbi:hypothetical protein Gpo141_00005327 [Globisporangium polare]